MGLAPISHTDTTLRALLASPRSEAGRMAPPAVCQAIAQMAASPETGRVQAMGCRALAAMSSSAGSATSACTGALVGALHWAVSSRDEGVDVRDARATWGAPCNVPAASSALNYS